MLLHLCTFTGLQALPLYVAQRHGFFAAADLDVTISYAVGSATQIAGLVNGAYDLIQTAPDNVIFVESNPEAFGLAGAPRIAMILGGSVGPLSIFARERFATPESLRGAILGVDSPTSGFALVVRDLLESHGLHLGQDYTFTTAGGTSIRLTALASSSIDATLLYPPFDTVATAMGLRQLATSVGHYSAYASLATAGRRAWLATHAHAATAYITCILRALTWIYDEANVGAAQALLTREPTLALDARAAQHAYAAFVAPETGFGRLAPLDADGLRQVIALRRRYGTQTIPLGTPDDYCNLR